MTDRRAAGILAALPAHVDVAAVRRDDCTLVLAEPDAVVVASDMDAFAQLDQLAPGFWVAMLSFELGHAVERVEPRGASRDVAMVPDLLLARFDAAARVTPTGDVEVVGHGRGRVLLEDAVHDPRAAGTPARLDGPWASSLDRDEHAAGVRAVLELLVAGDCYQVNLTRRLRTRAVVDPVAVYGALAHGNPAPHAALVRMTVGGAPLGIVSASPERFLRWRGRAVETRPIKGTATSAAALQASAKDRAENVMIVDLARNDLGRVCVPGSIRVPTLCAVESHPGLHHLVSTVVGTLRADVGLGGLLRATFPPASVTGAPKPRVLQAIEDLEPVRRGAYCGALGWIDTATDDGDLAVAIRTFTMADGVVDLGVGGGIVADSDPLAEWQETELKASRLLESVGSPALATVG